MQLIPVTVIRLLVRSSALIALAAVASSAAAQQSFAPQRPQARFELPERYRPPPGMCRIWLDSVPPNRQPAPTDCASAIRNLPPNARVVFSDSAAAKRAKKGKVRKPETGDSE